MRDLLDKLDTLNESTGLAGRKAGDVFRNSQGEEIVFKSIQFFPQQGGKLERPDLDTAIAQVEATPGGVKWQNAKSARTGGFAIATFTKGDQDFLVGRYLEQVKPDPTDNYVPNQVDDYKFSGKAAAKAQAGLSPQDLLTDKFDQTIPKVMNQLAKSLGTDHPLYEVAHRVAMGEKLPITFKAPAGISFSAFRDYFCEILQPIALQTGQYTGNAGEAAEIFLGGTFANTLISWDDSKTAGLSDSTLKTQDGRTVNLSSKGGKGATASAGNLVNVVDKLLKAENVSDDTRKLIEKNADVIQTLRAVQEKGQAGAPLWLGVKYKVIDKADAEQIVGLKNAAPINLANIDQVGLTDNLKALALERGTDNPAKVNLYYHLIAAVAHKAAAKINEKTNFSKSAAEILNNGALVQVYTKAKESKDNWTLEEFQTVYPGETIKGVYLSAGKTYYSTGIKGNFTFKIDKGTGVPKEEPQAAPAAAPSAPEKKKSVSDIFKRAKGQEVIEPLEQPENVGRKRRSKI